jgi:hypothetical protein
MRVRIGKWDYITLKKIVYIKGMIFGVKKQKMSSTIITSFGVIG